MEQMIDIYMKIALTVGTLCLVCIALVLIVWAIRSVVRSITDIRYASKVKFYLEDGHRKIVEYEKRIQAMENNLCMWNEE